MSGLSAQDMDARLKQAASEITDLWWARPDEGGAAKTAVVEEILRKYLGVAAQVTPDNCQVQPLLNPDGSCTCSGCGFHMPPPVNGEA